MKLLPLTLFLQEALFGRNEFKKKKILRLQNVYTYMLLLKKASGKLLSVCKKDCIQP